jgi:hypothetical protein
LCEFLKTSHKVNISPESRIITAFLLNAPISRAKDGMPGAQQPAWQLLGFCDSRIVVPRPPETRVFRRIGTPVPVEPKTLGDCILWTRVERRLHQHEVAAILGVARATMSAWETNLYQPKGKDRERALVWLGVETVEKYTSNFRGTA